MSGSAAIGTWLPLVITLVTLAGGAFIYHFQKKADRKNEILRERRVLYRQFVSTMAEYNLFCTISRNDEAFFQAVARGEQLKAELLVSAPDSVSDALVAFEEAYTRLPSYCMQNVGEEVKANALKEFGEKLGAILHEMRKDTFEDTKISAEMTVGVFGLPKKIAISWGNK
ncbi:MAG: hypothetical protein V7786_04475 [Sulfitobacter litoralis]|uniref:LemA protein n=1 Tax=Sulfitobacter litoralis TaxID=335975 RepID=A0ABY0RJA0_9RHOB|nr:hypothetical protein [Sulfitobacter litoralis]MBQ0716421.1 hypothetical protein [Sulfitobacter litoralis]SDO17163.1 hypothetical protein SAMN04488512_101202 [Sulfitobacter litoralis]